MVEQDAGAGHEHAGVPAVVAGGQVGGGRRRVGLLGEGQDAPPVGGAGDPGRAPAVDVAEGGRRAARLDADGGHPPRLRQRGRLAHGADEGGLVGDGVVGGEGADDRPAAVTGGDDGGGQADGGHGVARGGLGQQVLARQAGQLVGDGGQVGGPGDHADRGGHRLQAGDGALEEGAARAGEVEEELGARAPAQRPQPGARPPGGDDGVDGAVVAALAVLVLHGSRLAVGAPAPGPRPGGAERLA